MAQIPRTLSVQLVFGSPLPDDGVHPVHVRWYSDPLDGAVLWQESVIADIRQGQCQVVLGRSSAIPDTLLRNGQIYLGYNLDAESERQPRIAIVPSAMSLSSAYAEMAARLDPRATGLVTSINELAGPVSLIAGNGVQITRNGSTLEISSLPPATESGMIPGDGLTNVYRVRPRIPLRLDQHVTFDVRSPTTILFATVKIDVQANELVFSVSAILLQDEYISWSICQ